MTVLHLLSNHRWTGPAEPALNLCLALRARGMEVAFACSPIERGGPNAIITTARDRGIEPLLLFRLGKHRHPLWNLQDRLSLTRYLRQHPCDLIHCHMDNDHTIAQHASATLGIPIVRSNYFGGGFPETPRYRRLLGTTAWLVEPSRRALEHDAEAFVFPRERMDVVPGAVDLERFDPRRETPDGRRWLKIPPEKFVVGVVARLHPDRGYDRIFVAFRELLEGAPEARLIVLGRGPDEESVTRQPVRRFNLAEYVYFPGHLGGDDYVGMLRAFDAGVYLAPGTDGTCRTVRELMAMGKPVVVADGGMLGEIVTHEKDGLVFDGTAKGLCNALRGLAHDRQRRARLGQAARQTALDTFALEAQGKAVETVYEKALRVGTI